MSVRYLRHASCAYSATPPDLFGNMHASSAWMLFCSAPRQIEMVHSRNAPVVPRAPIDRPSDAIRNPGFASATTKPSHHVMALRSCLSSTWAVATASPPPPTPRLASGHTVNKLAHPAGRRGCTTCRERSSTEVVLNLPSRSDVGPAYDRRPGGRHG